MCTHSDVTLKILRADFGSVITTSPLHKMAAASSKPRCIICDSRNKVVSDLKDSGEDLGGGGETGEGGPQSNKTCLTTAPAREGLRFDSLKHLLYIN